jgi:hypothetical protein
LGSDYPDRLSGPTIHGLTVVTEIESSDGKKTRDLRPISRKKHEMKEIIRICLRAHHVHIILE